MNTQITRRVRLLTSLLLLVVPGSSSTSSFSEETTTQPRPKTVIHLTGLGANVTVSRDYRSVPYIDAATDADLYLAQGYVTASDRLWQMDLLRRTARGELAEIFGGAAMEEDKRHRVLGFAQLADKAVASVSPRTRKMLEAYAHGVNSFITSCKAQDLPIEFRLLKYEPGAWQPADSLVIGKLFDEALSTTWHADLMRSTMTGLSPEQIRMLFPEQSPLDVPIVGKDKPGKAASRYAEVPGIASPDLGRDLAVESSLRRRSLERVGLYAKDLAASNNWVVSGKLTASGKPLLANDPHLSPTAPSIWYMTHLSAPGIQVAGVTVPGVPGIILGHNDRIAWGITNLNADVADLYRETFKPDHKSLYKTPAGWREAHVRREEIKVRKNMTGSEMDITPLDIIETRNGPVVLEKNEARYALRWTGLRTATPAIEVFDAINRARNWSDFRAALSRFVGPPLNFVYADIDNHIGYYAGGLIPIRKFGSGVTPYEGADDKGRWSEFIPFERLPHLYDPPSGVIITANNRVVGNDYPFTIAHQWDEPYRARRIFNLLRAKTKMTSEDFAVIQADTYSIPEVIFTTEVVKIARRIAPKSSEWGEMLASFDGWDGRAQADSTVMLLADALRNVFGRRILAGVLGTERAQQYFWNNDGTLIDYLISAQPAEWLPKETGSYEELLLASYKETLSELEKYFGSDRSQWKWSKSIDSVFPHPLAEAPFIGQRFTIATEPMSGVGSAVNVGVTVSMRLIADLYDMNRTRLGIPLGQSGDPASPHWKDQYRSWQEVKPGVLPFTHEAIAKAARNTTVLAPQAAN